MLIRSREDPGKAYDITRMVSIGYQVPLGGLSSEHPLATSVSQGSSAIDRVYGLQDTIEEILSHVDINTLLYPQDSPADI